MAIIKNGINGDVSGKAGSVVFVKGKTGTYARGLPRKSTKNKLGSSDQRKFRTKFSLVHYSLRPMLPFVKLGFKLVDTTKAAYNNAMSYNLRHAVQLIDNIPAIDWTNFKIAHGIPNPITNFDIHIDSENNVLNLTWDFHIPSHQKERCTDFQCHFVLINYENNIFHPIQYNKISYPLSHKRQDIVLQENKEAVFYQAFVFFFASDGSNRCTDSLYLGEIYC